MHSLLKSTMLQCMQAFKGHQTVPLFFSSGNSLLLVVLLSTRVAGPVSYKNGFEAGLRTDSPRHVPTTSKHFQSRDLKLKMEIWLCGVGSGYKLRHGYSYYGGCEHKNTGSPAEIHIAKSPAENSVELIYR